MRLSVALALVAVAACDCGEDPRGDRRFGDDDSFKLDAGLHSDARADDGGGEDSDAHRDASASDRGFPTFADASDDDAGSDGGSDDSGSDDGGAFDSGASDSGAFDSGDTGIVDTGIGDTGIVDTGIGDTGIGDTGIAGDLWIEIDYRGANSPQSPVWDYSNTPGWQASDWAFTGGGCCAEAWDRFNNMSVVNDPIGESLEIHPSAQLQLMFGVARLTGYTAVTVELEGRSRDTSAFVQFDVTNPANGCGVANLTMDQDWTPDVVQVDLTPCLDVGSMLQAIRVEPTGGSSNIALLRMRLTIHGALF